MEEKVDNVIQNIDTSNKENDIEENNNKIDVNDVEEKVDEPIKIVDIVEPVKENVNLNENKKKYEWQEINDYTNQIRKWVCKEINIEIKVYLEK